MKSKTMVIFGILLMSLTLVSAIYPGETKTIDNTLNDNLTWSIQDNNTIIEGLIVNITLEKISVTFPGDLPTGSFSILFQSEEEETIIKVSSSGGSSSSSSSRIIHVVDSVSGRDYGDASKYPTYNNEEVVEEDTPEEEEIIIEPIIEEEEIHLWPFLVLGVILIFAIIFGIIKFSAIKSNSLENFS